MAVEIIKKGQYNNVALLTKFKRNGVNLVLDASNVPIVVQQGLAVNEEAILTKVGFAEGRALPSRFPRKDGSVPNNYSCKASLNGEEVTFWLNEEQHSSWALMGGVDDKVKVKCISKEDGFGGYKQALEFSKVE